MQNSEGAPVYSALTLRLVLASFGIFFFVGAAIAAMIGSLWWLGAILWIGAIVGVVDIVVIARRKHRGEPG